MNTATTAAGLALAAVVLLWAPDSSGAQGGDAGQEVRARLKAWDEAYARRDTAALDRILADDYVLTDAGGAVLTRAEYLSSTVKAPEFSREKSWDSEEVQVRVYGDTAVVTGASPVKGRPRGRSQAFSARYRFTDVWVKRHGSWKAVATHATRVGPDRP